MLSPVDSITLSCLVILLIMLSSVDSITIAVQYIIDHAIFSRQYYLQLFSTVLIMLSSVDSIYDKQAVSTTTTQIVLDSIWNKKIRLISSSSFNLRLVLCLYRFQLVIVSSSCWYCTNHLVSPSPWCHKSPGVVINVQATRHRMREPLWSIGSISIPKKKVNWCHHGHLVVFKRNVQFLNALYGFSEQQGGQGKRCAINSVVFSKDFLMPALESPCLQ